MHAAKSRLLMAWMHVQQRLMMRLRYSLLVLLLVWSASILLYMHPNLQTHIGVGKTGAQPGPSKRCAALGQC